VADRPTIVILALGRAGALGERRRVEMWRALAAEAGLDAEVVELCSVARGRPSAGQVTAAWRGRAAPEQLAWSLPRVNDRLRSLQPALVVCCTTRAFHPSIAREHRVVLDLVDSLADSYAQRARIHRGALKRAAFGALAAAHRRLEHRVVCLPVQRVVAGRSDEGRFVATWIPNVLLEPLAAAGRVPQPQHDLVFFGSLGYPPNVAGLEVLARQWPALRATRPDVSLLVAGSSPAPAVREMAARHGWALESGYADPSTLCRRARIALAPLPHAAGFQNKVLEAAAAGVAQVVSPAVTRGLDGDFPVVVADERGLVAAVDRLLGDDRARRELADRARAHVEDRYRAERHAGFLTAALASGGVGLDWVPVVPMGTTAPAGSLPGSPR
jgi:glycosyltransferase involved in cell wall biosynthesis